MPKYVMYFLVTKPSRHPLISPERLLTYVCACVEKKSFIAPFIPYFVLSQEQENAKVWKKNESNSFARHFSGIFSRFSLEQVSSAK